MKTTKKELRDHMAKEILKSGVRGPVKELRKWLFQYRRTPIRDRLIALGLSPGKTKLLLDHAYEWLNTQEALKNSHEYITLDKVRTLL